MGIKYMKNKILTIIFGMIASSLIIYIIIQTIFILAIDIDGQYYNMSFFSYPLILQIVPLLIIVVCESITIVSSSNMLKNKKNGEIKMKRNKIYLRITGVFTIIFCISFVALLVLLLTNKNAKVMNFDADKFFYFLTMINILLLNILFFIDAVLMIKRKND